MVIAVIPILSQMHHIYGLPFYCLLQFILCPLYRSLPSGMSLEFPNKSFCTVFISHMQAAYLSQYFLRKPISKIVPDVYANNEVPHYLTFCSLLLSPNTFLLTLLSKVLSLPFFLDIRQSFVKGKGKFLLVTSHETQRGSRGVALLFP